MVAHHNPFGLRYRSLVPLRAVVSAWLVRRRQEFGPAADLLWYLHNFASQSEQIPASRACIDKKVGNEASPADSALAVGGLPCAARSLRVGQNSLRGLRPLRSNSCPKSDVDARCRALPQSPALLSSSEGENNTSEHQQHQPASLRFGTQPAVIPAQAGIHDVSPYWIPACAGMTEPMRSEACGEEIAACVRRVLSMAMTSRSL
jgi:hypothetical protein